MENTTGLQSMSKPRLTGHSIQLLDSAGQPIAELVELVHVERDTGFIGRQFLERDIYRGRLVPLAPWASSDAKRLLAEAFEAGDGGCFAYYEVIQDQIRTAVSLRDREHDAPVAFIHLDQLENSMLLLRVDAGPSA